MINLKKLALLKEILNNTEQQLSSAKLLLAEALGETDLPNVDLSAVNSLSDAIATDGGKVIEGVFDGQGMVDKDKRTYPVPANYASKSKLVTGDLLKLTITPEGRFLYKQIGPTEREYLVGPLTYENGQYKVITKAGTYKVLTASVTYFKAEIGDEVTLIVPKGQETEWAAVEAVIPKLKGETISSTEDSKKTSEKPTEDALEGDNLDF